MQIFCPACGQRLQISDDLIPQDGRMRVACPSCGGYSPIDLGACLPAGGQPPASALDAACPPDPSRSEARAEKPSKAAPPPPPEPVRSLAIASVATMPPPARTISAAIAAAAPLDAADSISPPALVRAPAPPVQPGAAEPVEATQSTPAAPPPDDDAATPRRSPSQSVFSSQLDFRPVSSEQSAGGGEPAGRYIGLDVDEHWPDRPLVIDVLEAGPGPRGLVCLDRDAHRDKCEAILASLGCHTVHIASNTAEALAYLSQVDYECILLDEQFDGAEIELNPVLACVHQMPIDRRRKALVALCSAIADSGDTAQAYSQSVNLTVNYSDIPTSRRILEDYLAGHRRLYRVFGELNRELGKE
ncbi:MAG: hypothetical protein MJE77_27685 [Proteobacteria bacterium]|nr:hypothetical protein [Pseudomonadota bacterium]